MTPQEILLWAQVGGEMVKIGATSIRIVRELISAEDVIADEQQLARLDALYAQRIARAEAAAKPSAQGDGDPG